MRRPRAAPARRAGRAPPRRGSGRSGTTAARAARWRSAGGARASTASFTAISACSRISRRMSGPRIASAVELVDRLDGRRPALVVEHRQLAEDLARAERRERELAPVGVLADRPRVPAADDVARVRGVALAEDGLAGAEAAGHRHRGDGAELRRAELGEGGDLREERGRVLDAGRHPAGIPHGRRATGPSRARRPRSEGVERVVAPAPAARPQRQPGQDRDAARTGARRRARSPRRPRRPRARGARRAPRRRASSRRPRPAAAAPASRSATRVSATVA